MDEPLFRYSNILGTEDRKETEAVEVMGNNVVRGG